MKLVTKKFIKILIIALCLSVLLIIFYFVWPSSNVTVDRECSDVIDFSHYGGFGADLSFEGCYGVLAQEKNLDDYNYYIYDHQHRYSVAVLQEKNAFKVVGELLYLIQPQKESEQTSFLEEFGHYYAAYYIDGDFQKFEYNSLNETPKYLAIDINSGEVTIYSNNLNEIPETERQIFQELENE